MRRIAIRLLGPFEVSINGATVTGFAYAKVRALLAYLAVERRQPHTRAALAALLWPDQPERAARASLSQALTTLRNALDDKDAERPLLLADTQHIQLDPAAPIELDLAHMLAGLRAADAHAHASWRTCATCAEQLGQAISHYRGPFLADLSIGDSELFEEWAGLQREHTQQRAISALERLVERAQWRGAYQEALSYAQRLIALDPLLEEHQRACMRLLALNGEQSAALAQYRQLRAALAHELALEPEPATTALIEQIRRGDLAALQPARPPFRVPAPPAPLVSRAAELRAICAHVRDLRTRALTITGAGGIGKTRLALEAAHALRHDFEQGVCFVELAALDDPALVADAIARALSVQERPCQSIGATLREHLREQQLLLVLDNFEHVAAAATLVSELLAACPALTILVTSRAPLTIRAEQQLALGPLAETDAVLLFLQRALAAGADLSADPAELAIYAAICQRLDLLPLAIELIAVRARTLAPRELLRQLERPLQVLVDGPRDLPTRHQALRSAIGWSYDLLSAEEQRAFASLGVFVGGCSAEAAQAVIGQSPAAQPLLAALHAASLLQQQSAAGETRFVMLETIREFALEQLVARGEAAAASRRHTEHYVGFAAAVGAELFGAEAPRWQARAAAEQGNLRAAFRWAMEQQAYEHALRIASGIWRFHWMGGRLHEGLDRLEAALAYREQAPLDLQAAALRAAGTLAGGLSDFARARRWLEAAVAASWRLGDPSALQAVLNNLGQVLLEQGELEDARIHLEVSLSLAQRATNTTATKFPLGLLASLHRRLGDYAQAQAFGEECLRINQAAQDTEGIANALRSLGAIVSAQDDFARARQLAEQALALHRSLSHQLGIGLDYALLGEISAAEGDRAAALEHYQSCLRHWRERENSVNSALVLDSIAQIVTSQGEAALAATLLAAATAARELAGAKLAGREQAQRDASQQACRSALGEAAFALATAEGRALTLGQAIDLALRQACLVG